MQHQRRDRYRESPYDTAVFVLQNDAGGEAFRVPARFEETVRGAFALAVPTEAAKERRRKAGRGFGDADGGGGVYRGKKAKRTGEGVVKRRTQEYLAEGGGGGAENGKGDGRGGARKPNKHKNKKRRRDGEAEGGEGEAAARGGRQGKTGKKGKKRKNGQT